MLEGLDGAFPPDSRYGKLEHLKELGFQICPYLFSGKKGVSEEQLSQNIEFLKMKAQENFLPIDGIVAIYDSLSYSKAAAGLAITIKTVSLLNLKMKPTRPFCGILNGHLPAWENLPR